MWQRPAGRTSHGPPNISGQTKTMRNEESMKQLKSKGHTYIICRNRCTF